MSGPGLELALAPSWPTSAATMMLGGAAGAEVEAPTGEMEEGVQEGTEEEMVEAGRGAEEGRGAEVEGAAAVAEDAPSGR